MKIFKLLGQARLGCIWIINLCCLQSTASKSSWLTRPASSLAVLSCEDRSMVSGTQIPLLVTNGVVVARILLCIEDTHDTRHSVKEIPGLALCFLLFLFYETAL